VPIGDFFRKKRQKVQARQPSQPPGPAAQRPSTADPPKPNLTDNDDTSWFSKILSIYIMPFKSAAKSLEQSATRIENAMDSRNNEDKKVRTSYTNFEQFSASRKDQGFPGSSRNGKFYGHCHLCMKYIKKEKSKAQFLE